MGNNYWQKFNEEHTYHIYHHAAENLNLFNDDSDYSIFLKKYALYFSPYFDLYAYCLMPNHFHLLCQLKPDTIISDSIKKEKTKMSRAFRKGEIPINDFLEDQMRRFLSSFSLIHKNKYTRNGPLFRKRFKRVKVKSENKLSYLLCYIHHNPIHHNFVTNYQDWPYSSYNQYLNGKKHLVNKEGILEWMNGKDQFKKTHSIFKSEYKTRDW